MTPREIFDMASGYQERMDTQMHIVAWHACLIRNVHLKRSDQKTPEQLLKKTKKQSPQEIQSQIEKAFEMVKGRRETIANGSNNSVPSY